jgi:hypothetical protein
MCISDTLGGNRPLTPVWASSLLSPEIAGYRLTLGGSFHVNFLCLGVMCLQGTLPPLAAIPCLFQEPKPHIVVSRPALSKRRELPS